MVGLASGALRYPPVRFFALVAIGACLWVGCGFAIAAAGQGAAPGSPWLGVGLGLLVVLALTSLVR